MKSIHIALVVAIIFKLTGIVIVATSYPLLILAIAINIFIFLVIEIVKQVVKQAYNHIDNK